MIYLLKAYFNFLIRSTNQHGVHSPFVFGLVTKCFYDKKKYSSYELLKNYRRSLGKDNRLIEVKDFGAGSRVFKSNERKISEIAKNAGISPKRARLLNRLIKYFNVENALELGTSLGIGTAAMAAGNDVRITTIEGCPETAAIAREKFEDFGLSGIQLIVGRFEDVLEINSRSGITDNPQPETENSQFQIPNSKSGTHDSSQLRPENSKFQIPNSKSGITDNPQPTTENRELRTENSKSQIPKSKPGKPENPQPETEISKSDITDNSEPTTYNPQPRTDNRQLRTDNFSIPNTEYSLLYIDGNHQKEATLEYFEALLPRIHNDSVMIFDDIHWSRNMEAAWEEIKAHPRVKVSIDTFQWGLVFFRREQEKEHFVIRV